MRINHNITAMNSYRNFSANGSKLSKNLEKLSTGMKINRAGDDAAGLAISEKMRAQISGLDGATKNAKDGISLIQTAEGALTEVHDMLNRMVTLAEQSANGTYQDELDREQLQKEIVNLKDEINRVADSTNYNGIQLLNGDLDYAKETTVTADSAISNIQTGDHSSKGDCPAITAKFINERPNAPTTQQSAQFKIDLNNVNFDVKANDKFSIKIGNTSIEIKASAAITTASAAAAEIVQFGKAANGATGVSTSGTGGSSTAEWQTAISAVNDAYATGAANAANNFVMINGHAWKMTAADGVLTFDQQDNMGSTGGTVVDPDYGVSLEMTNAQNGTGNSSIGNQQPNWRVQQTKTGIGVGAKIEAQAEIDIDFSKLKDGDKLTIGEKTYQFKIGTNNKALDADAASGGYIDLTDIFEKETDQSDKTKQKRALDKTVGDIGAADSEIWTTGNGGVKDGIGTLTLQSKKTFADVGNTTTHIGGVADNPYAKLTTEDEVMKQLYGVREEQAATASFEVDVTKIKKGDTFTIDGQTFEFTDNDVGSSDNYVKINLKDEGLGGGIAKSSTSQVMAKIEQAIKGGSLNGSSAKAPGVQLSDGTNRYNTRVEDNKIILTSRDDNKTETEFEDRVSADIKTPSETTFGKGLVLQIGDTSEDFNHMSVSVADMHSEALGIGDVDVSTQEGAASALDSIKAAVNKVSDTRGNLGAMQNRLEHTINNLGVMKENVQSAESLIRDTDVAEEMMTFTKNNILNQASQAMLAQANQLPQGVLQLLG